MSPRLALALRDMLRNIVNKDFGENQTHAAEALGISQAQVSDVLSEKRGVGGKVLESLLAYDERGFLRALGTPLAELDDPSTDVLEPGHVPASPSAPARDDAPTSETSITQQAARILPQNTGTPPYELRRLDVSEVRALAVHEAPGPTYEAAPRAELTTFAEFVGYFGPQLGMNAQAIAEVSRDAAATGWAGLIGEEAKRYVSERWDRMKAMPKVHQRAMPGDAAPAPDDGKSERERLREEMAAAAAKKPSPKGKGPRKR